MLIYTNESTNFFLLFSFEKLIIIKRKKKLSFLFLYELFKYELKKCRINKLTCLDLFFIQIELSSKTAVLNFMVFYPFLEGIYQIYSRYTSYF